MQKYKYVTYNINGAQNKQTGIVWANSVSDALHSLSDLIDNDTVAEVEIVEHIESDEAVVDGKLHRENGPAYECANGQKEYWLNGVQLIEEEFISRIETLDGKVAEIDGKKYKLTLV